MVSPKITPRLRQPWPWWRWVLTGLISLALALSAFLGWHYLVGGTVIGCSTDSPCEQVLNGRWSSVGGVLPVSGLAAGAYLAMLVASFFVGPATEAPVRRLAWRALLVLIGAAAGSAVWFFIVQKWIIGAFCPYCMATHIIGLILTALIIWRAPAQLDVSRRVVGIFPTIGLALAGILAACQISITPPAVYVGGESQEKMPAIDPHAVPLIGSPDAPLIVNVLFDYKCPRCQKLHFMLDEVVRRYGGKLAFTLNPAPMNPRCNPYVPREVNEFKDSCELAKIGLAVWLAKRDAFPAFESWMFSLESGDAWHARSLDDARAKAVELVGQAKFDTARADPWIDRYLQTCVEIYGRTGTGVPKLVFGLRWVTPELNNAEDLVSILHDSLGVPSP